MFRSLKINSFRMFTDKEIYLGRYVTALAGRNSTGKSTVLGMLGNSSELKKKEGATYTDGRFRAEFSELFKGSTLPIQLDKITSDKYSWPFCHSRS